MLYLWHEWQRAVLAPLHLVAEAGRQWHTSEANPWRATPLAQAMAAGCEALARATKTYPKPAFGISTTGADGAAVREESVLRLPFCDLLHFARDTARCDPQVLLVAPLSGHYATLLRGTVEALLPEHDVYITDWRDARTVPVEEGEFSFDDYVAYLQTFLRHLGPATHVIAVCQPSVPALAAIALMAANGEPTPRSMTFIGGPIDTRRGPTAVNEFATSRPHSWYRDNLIHRVPAGHPGQGRKVYPGFLQLAGFVSLNPHKHLESHQRFLLALLAGNEDAAVAHRRFYDEYNAVMDLPAQYYLDTLRIVFQDHELARGTLTCLGQRVDPAAIRHTALMTVEGGQDDICGPGQTEAAHELCPNIPAWMRAHLVSHDAGHYGIFSGAAFRAKVLPRLTAFIRRHDRQLRAVA